MNLTPYKVRKTKYKKWEDINFTLLKKEYKGNET